MSDTPLSLPRGHWVAEALRRIHPERLLCNCSRAYYDSEGRCAHGCSANQYDAKDILAEAYLREVLNHGGTND